MTDSNAVDKALQVIDGQSTDEEKYQALCDLEFYRPDAIPIDRICNLLESLNSDVVETTLRLVASSSLQPIPDCLLSPSFLLRLGWITASSMSRSIASESADLLAALLWQSDGLQDAAEGGVVLSGFLCEAFTYHMKEFHEDIVGPSLHCLLRLLLASSGGPMIAETILTRVDVLQPLIDAMDCSEYDSDRIPVLACSVLAQSLRLQASLPEQLHQVLGQRQVDVMRSIGRITLLCSSKFVLPVIGAILNCCCWSSLDQIDNVIAFIDNVCVCLSLAIETSFEQVNSWVVPICVLAQPIIHDTKRRLLLGQSTERSLEQGLVLERANSFVSDVLDKYANVPLE
jgi:hypothetical protein